MKAPLAALTLLLLCGCTTAISERIRTNGRMVSYLQTVFGLDVSPNPTAGGYPGVRLGLVRNEIVFIFDGTNEVPNLLMETDGRNGSGLFQNGSIRRKVASGPAASTDLPPLAGRSISNSVIRNLPFRMSIDLPHDEGQTLPPLEP